MSTLTDFFNLVLAGEAKTYNDHNWYTSGGLKGYIEGRGKTPYPLLTQPLSNYTLAEIKGFQSRGRDSNGQLWATGRYQIIPKTLKGLQADLALPDSALYNQENQDKMGLQLLLNRSDIKKYIKGEVDDNPANLEKAALHMAMIWSSIGVPFDTTGRHGSIRKNQSYYSGGGDRASVDTALVQEQLKLLRKNFGSGNLTKESKQKSSSTEKKRPWIAIVLVISLGLVSFVTYKLVKTNK